MCQAIEEMIEDGRIEGRLEGGTSVLRMILRKKGDISENLEKKILEVKDLNILAIWCQKAMDAQNMAEFEQSI